jgi:DHA2 family multidrug resistance protein
MRNLGGSVGISLATTLLARRSQMHQMRLADHLTPTSAGFQRQLMILKERFAAQGMDAVTAMKQALASIYHSVGTQADMLSYLDIFKVLMFASFLAAALTLFLKRIDLKNVKAGH